MNAQIASKVMRQALRLTVGLAFALAALALLVATASTASAGSKHSGKGKAGVVHPEGSYNGQTYSEWSAQWFQWVYSLPSTHHPLFDNADCSVGQRGNVWFIGGKLGGSSAVNRDCTIPEGTALFLAIANSSWDNGACNGNAIQPTTFTTEELRTLAQDSLDGFLDARGKCTIDGTAVKNLDGLHTRFRVESPVFDYTIPSVDNVLILINGPCYNNVPPDQLTIPGAVGDGVYVLIKPLPAGQHTIRFGNPGGVALGNVYNITVTPADN